MGCCLGCCDRPSLNSTIDDQKGFWSTSTCDLESALQSQRSLLSITTMNQPLDVRNGATSTSNRTEFVNHGLILWNQTRKQWNANRTDRNRRREELPISWNGSYESLLRSNNTFANPIALTDLVDCLVDTWEEEGLYD